MPIPKEPLRFRLELKDYFLESPKRLCDARPSWTGNSARQKEKENSMLEKCLNPHCASVPRARGLCTSCYIMAAKLIKRKETSWAKLEKAGKAFPKQPRKSIKSWLLG